MFGWIKEEPDRCEPDAVWVNEFKAPLTDRSIKKKKRTKK